MVSWSSGARRRRLPDNWASQRGSVCCLACRCEMAGDAVLAKMPKDASEDSRRKADVAARIEFEIKRA